MVAVQWLAVVLMLAAAVALGRISFSVGGLIGFFNIYSIGIYHQGIVVGSGFRSLE